MNKKVAAYLDEDLLHQTRATATRTGRTEHEIIEAALRQYLRHESAPMLNGQRQRRDDLLRIAQQRGRGKRSAINEPLRPATIGTNRRVGTAPCEAN